MGRLFQRLPPEKIKLDLNKSFLGLGVSSLCLCLFGFVLNILVIATGDLSLSYIENTLIVDQS